MTSIAPTRSDAVVARAVVRLAVRRRPGAGRVLQRIDPSVNPATLLTLGERTVGGRRYVKVLISHRGRHVGWILADHVEMSHTPWRIEINRARRRLVLRRAGRTVYRTRIVVGAPATPTPVGQFAVYRVVPKSSSSALGPFAIHLTAFSDVLHEFDGGPGRVAIHGMRGSLVVPLGSAASHGCIRIPNRAARFLATRVRSGTPVTIKAR